MEFSCPLAGTCSSGRRRRGKAPCPLKSLCVYHARAASVCWPVDGQWMRDGRSICKPYGSPWWGCGNTKLCPVKQSRYTMPPPSSPHTHNPVEIVRFAGEHGGNAFHTVQKSMILSKSASKRGVLCLPWRCPAFSPVWPRLALSGPVWHSPLVRPGSAFSPCVARSFPA